MEKNTNRCPPVRHTNGQGARLEAAGVGSYAKNLWGSADKKRKVVNAEAWT